VRVRECVCIGGRGGRGGGGVCVTEARRAEQVAREEQGERHEREQHRQRGETERQTKEALSEKGICWINFANLCPSVSSHLLTNS
jgi:hypothetical protein